jgi:hypothetical protein
MRDDIRYLEVQTARGNDDMDCDFGLNEPFGLVFVRVHFRDLSAGTGVADMTLSVDDADGPDFDCVLYGWVDNGVVDRRVGISSGASKDANLCIPYVEQNRWLFLPRDRLKLAWTNPDTDLIAWGVKVGLLPVRYM